MLTKQSLLSGEFAASSVDEVKLPSGGEAYISALSLAALDLIRAAASKRPQAEKDVDEMDEREKEALATENVLDYAAAALCEKDGTLFVSSEAEFNQVREKLRSLPIADITAIANASQAANHESFEEDVLDDDAKNSEATPGESSD